MGHKSVLLAEVVKQLTTNKRGIFVDCTLGGAGHAKAILEGIEASGFLVGIDQDTSALDAAKVKLKDFSRQILLIKGNFGELDQLLSSKVEGVDGFLFDLGVSSMQIDIAERGFSYKHDGPLDMRMNTQASLSAFDVVNSYSRSELIRVIRNYGEERWASRIADFILRARERNPLKTTFELVGVIKDAIPASARRRGGHPARKTFQAIRIEVNDELKVVERALWQAYKWLNVGGRIVVLSYHSLEDRIVKRIFQKLQQGFICKEGFNDCIDYNKPLVQIINRKPMTPSEEEIEENPRARSAKLRVIERAKG